MVMMMMMLCLLMTLMLMMIMLSFQFGSRSILGRFDRAFSAEFSLVCSLFFTGAYSIDIEIWKWHNNILRRNLLESAKNLPFCPIADVNISIKYFSFRLQWLKMNKWTKWNFRQMADLPNQCNSAALTLFWWNIHGW